MLKTGDKVKSLLDGKIYTIEKVDELNKVVRLEEISGMWNLKDFELIIDDCNKFREIFSN